MLKAFKATYSASWAYGGYEEIIPVVVANTEEEAYGLLLTKYDDLFSNNWYIDEIDLTDISVDELSRRCS